METGRKLKRGKGDTAMNVALTIQHSLKDLRVEQGLTLEQLEQRTSISKSTLGNYENGFIIASQLSYNANVEKFIFCAEHNFEMAESKH